MITQLYVSASRDECCGSNETLHWWQDCLLNDRVNSWYSQALSFHTDQHTLCIKPILASWNSSVYLITLHLYAILFARVHVCACRNLSTQMFVFLMLISCVFISSYISVKYQSMRFIHNYWPTLRFLKCHLWHRRDAHVIKITIYMNMGMATVFSIDSFFFFSFDFLFCISI